MTDQTRPANETGPAGPDADATSEKTDRRIASRVVEAASNLLLAAAVGLLAAAALSLWSTHLRVDLVWEALACAVASGVVTAFAPGDDEAAGGAA